MTVLKHTLIALGICVGSLGILFSQWAKLDARCAGRCRRCSQCIDLTRPLDTVEWFMSGRPDPPLSDKDVENFDIMTRFMDRILWRQ